LDINESKFSSALLLADVAGQLGIDYEEVMKIDLF